MNFRTTGNELNHHNNLFGCPDAGQANDKTCPNAGQVKPVFKGNLSRCGTTVSQTKAFYLSQCGTHILYIAIYPGFKRAFIWRI